MKLIFYRIKNLLSLREIIIGLAAILIAASTGAAAFDFMEKSINIYVDGTLTVVKTLGSTVRDAIESGEIKVSAYDYISIPLDTKLNGSDINSIYIKSSKIVNVEYNGIKYSIPTTKTYISEFLEDNDMTVEDTDRIEGFSISDTIADGMVIRIIKVEKKLEIEHEETLFDTIISKSNYMDFGEVKVTEAGVKGMIEHVYESVYENGVPVSKVKIYDQVLRAPQTQYESHGNIKTYVTSTGYTIRYTKVIEVRMTAYTASLKDTGKDVGHPLFGITYTGRKVGHGIVAVDPDVIKLNSRMYVEIDGATADYGFSTAADTGGAINGDIIDLYFDTQKFVDNWGTKWGRVYILAYDDPNLSLCPK
jgi:uncharacterized protein YabE (DUF348 family)/3D (Asp-Asp-Asp) domain-containing protein